MKEKYIDSSSRRDRLHLYIWMPKDQPKPGLIVQMTHGMVEHMGRYDTGQAFCSHIDGV